MTRERCWPVALPAFRTAAKNLHSSARGVFQTSAILPLQLRHDRAMNSSYENTRRCSCRFFYAKSFGYRHYVPKFSSQLYEKFYRQNATLTTNSLTKLQSSVSASMFRVEYLMDFNKPQLYRFYGLYVIFCLKKI